MPKKNLLGIDIGQNSVKLALVSGTTVLKTVKVELPDRLVQNGRIVSIEAMSQLIRAAMKENNINVRHAACIIGGDNVFIGNFTMPVMTHEQLMVNLPYEFRDFITEDLKDYTYDYAVISDSVPADADDGEGQSSKAAPHMRVMAVAAPTAVINETKDMCEKCGLKLVRLAPNISALIGLHRARNAGDTTEYCILDVGQRVARLHIFDGDEFIVTRVIEAGISSVEEAIADDMDVDVHLAHTYIHTNYNDCLHSESTTSAFNRLALEIMRAVNFYRFSNPDNKLEKIYICGGGAEILPLVEAIRSTIDLPVKLSDELLPSGAQNAAMFAQAIGITMD